MLEVIRPDWPAPARVQALTTTRVGGVSRSPFDQLNLATYVGDQLEDVLHNRQLLRETVNLPNEPLWLSQVHGVGIVDAACSTVDMQADGSFTTEPGVVCAVMTADCLPVLLTDRDGGCVAAAHAGWRGLADGVIEAAVAALPVAADQLLAWLGPAIGPGAFEVGDEVRDAFCAVDSQAELAFARQGDKWLADIYILARQRLAAVGVTSVYGGGGCTFTDQARFYSYRRDGQTGRMASLIWLT